MLLQQFKAFIQQHRLFLPTDRLLLAVSGGVDSVVLCELCHQAGVDFVIAHCNFQLRGEESNRDEAFVRSLAAKYQVPVFVKQFDTALYAEAHKQSIQVAARNLRYSWFLELSGSPELGGRVTFMKDNRPGFHATHDFRKPRIFTVTAHHANDSVETLLMNFFKGTGIKGLQGIKPVHELMNFLIRPLLFATKDSLLGYAKENGLNYVEDSSNESSKYTRNYFRNELIPAVQQVFPQAEGNLIDNLQRFGEIEELYNEAIALHKKKLIEHRGSEVHIPVLKLLKVPALQTVLYEIIKDYGFTAHQSADAQALLKSDTGKYIESASHRIIKNRNWIIISPQADDTALYYLVESTDDRINFGAGQLTLQKQSVSNWKLSSSNALAQLDAAEITFPLLLRKWRQGDYFYPLGMQKKKKLSRFLIDQKLSLPQKENTWVVEMNKKIIWVVGMRIDDRFKVAPSTREVLLMTLKNADASTV